jgi:hypothetical protein
VELPPSNRTRCVLRQSSIGAGSSYRMVMGIRLELDAGVVAFEGLRPTLR